MKHLYLMRHGETLFNTQNKIQGWCDSPLTENGKKQAIKAGELLKDISFDHYYSSTQERASDTLELVVGDVEYTRLKQLKERNFGSFEAESEYLNPAMNGTFSYDDLFPHYGGEYTKDVVERMNTILHEIMNKEDHINVLAVSHAGACMSFLSSVTDPSIIMKYGRFPNCGILHFTYENNTFTFVEMLKPEV